MTARRLRAPAIAALAAAAVLSLAGPLPAARAGDPPTGGAVFFREPDDGTKRRIQDLISQSSSEAVATRRRARGDLESVGTWAVDPLIAAAKDREPPVRCASILTLDAIADRRALDPLREIVVREDSNVYVGAYAALALGRFRDARCVDPFRKALANARVLELLHAAVPFALARVRTPEAAALLFAQTGDAGAAEPVQCARLLALGFFPEMALAQDGAVPGPLLEAGFASGRRGERQAALLAFCAATARPRTGKEFLARTADQEKAPQVLAIALVGLATYPDPDVTERLVRIAGGGSPDAIRELACDLLVPRADPAALSGLLQIVRTAASTRLRASAVLALGAIDANDARDAVLDRVNDKAPIVRAAAAVAAAGAPSAAMRDEALRRIDARLASREPDARVRDVFHLARAVLSGERREVSWPEVGQGSFFGSVAQSPRRRLMRAINRRVELSLDLGKLSNLQTDATPTADDSPGVISDLDPRGGSLEGVPSEENPRGGPSVGALPTPSVGAIGAARTSSWQELRDLAEELGRRPYFTEDDLPLAPAAATGVPRK